MKTLTEVMLKTIQAMADVVVTRQELEALQQATVRGCKSKGYEEPSWSFSSDGFKPESGVWDIRVSVVPPDAPVRRLAEAVRSSST